MGMHWLKGASLAALLAAAACTPTVTLRSGGDYETARSFAERYCAAIRTPEGEDEAELMTSELRRLFEGVEAAQRRRFLTSLGAAESCVPGRVEAFGPPPHIISIDSQIRVGRVRDGLHLRRDEGAWMIDDVVYGRARPIGDLSPFGLKMALRALADEARREAAQARREAAGLSTFRGRFRFGFEVATFEGCWIDLKKHWGQFEAPPAGSGGVYEYQIEFVGRRSEAPEGAEAEGRGFGHVGRYRCSYEIEELLSSRRVSP